MTVRIIAIVLGLVAAGYLAWWGWHFFYAWRAGRLAAAAAQQTDWSPALIEQLLEYARLLNPLSPEFARVCIGLAEREVKDLRARALFERYLGANNVTAQNAVVARQLACLIPPEPIDERRAGREAFPIEEEPAWAPQVSFSFTSGFPRSSSTSLTKSPR